MSTLEIHHLGLSVLNLNDTTDFFTDCLGWKVVREMPEYPARFVSNGHALLTLWQTNENAQSFDRKNNAGLHHVAIHVESRLALDELFLEVSDYPGVAIEFSPESLRGGPAQHFMIYEPSGLRMEFIAL